MNTPSTIFFMQNTPYKTNIANLDGHMYNKILIAANKI